MKTAVQRIVKEEIQKKIILEKKKSDLKKTIAILDLVIEENKRAQALNEDIGSLVRNFWSLIPAGGKDFAVESITRLIINAFSEATGIQVTPDSGFGKMLKNFVPEFIARGHVDLLNRFVLQGEESACRDFVKAVMDTIIETGKETLIDETLITNLLSDVTETLFGEPMELGKIASIGSGISRETVNAMLKDFLTPLIDPVTEFVCGSHDLERLRNDMQNALTIMSTGSGQARSPARQEINAEDLYTPEDPADLIRRIMREQ